MLPLRKKLAEQGQRISVTVRRVVRPVLETRVGSMFVALFVFALMGAFGVSNALATPPAFAIDTIIDSPSDIITEVGDNLGGALLLAIGLNLGFFVVRKVYRWAKGAAN